MGQVFMQRIYSLFCSRNALWNRRGDCVCWADVDYKHVGKVFPGGEKAGAASGAGMMIRTYLHGEWGVMEGSRVKRWLRKTWLGPVGSLGRGL